MIINNKLESIEKIKELNLNKFPEKTFKKNEEAKIKAFLKEYPASLYAIRDKSSPSGLFKFKVPQNEVLKEIIDYELFTINISSANYSNNQLLVGEIEILSNNKVYATLSKNKEYSVRDALCNPDFNVKTDIFDNDTLDKIPCFNELYDYIITNNLKDVIVEFSLFNINLGIKKEKIIIYELRTDY